MTEQATEQQIAEWKVEYPGGVFAWETEDLGTIYWHQPSEVTWRKFTDETAAGDRGRSECLLDLVTSCALIPSEQELRQLLRLRPMLLGQLAQQIQAVGLVRAKKEPRRL